jgi:hypothetical protein
MPHTVHSLDDLQSSVLAYFSNRFPGRDLGTESWLGKQARAIAMALLLIQAAVEDADQDSSPGPKTSTAALDAFAVLFGLPSNQGGYGRNGAVAASGGQGPVTGTNSTAFPNGSFLLASDGVTQFALSGGVTIPGIPPGSGSIAGKFVAVTTGRAGNLAANSLLAWVSPPVGADATVMLSSGLTGGLDAESDSALLQRIYDRLQKPPKGGAAVDYRTWAEAGSPAVARAYVYPNRGGLGTVEVVLTSGGSGAGRKPSPAAQTADDAFVLARRPVTVQGYLSLLPAMPAPNGLAIRARLKPSAKKYAFDWDDTGAAYSVNAYAAGPPATLTLNQLAPASLKSAIDNGALPRLQLEVTGGPTVPLLAQVTAWSDGGGLTTLTLQNPLPQGWIAPSNGDTVWAGGPIVTPIATALLAYVDGLGPSRADGYADPDDPWEDTCAIARLIEIALDVTDSDGITRFASNVSIPNGVTLNGAALDKTGLADIGAAPELLFAKAVVVRQ